MATDEDALRCDLAEAYGVIDWRGLSVEKLAVLACGLRDNSRIKIKMSGLSVSIETLLMACMVDKLNFLIWMQTKDGTKGRNRPKSFAETLAGKDNKDKDENVLAFDSAEDFEAALKRFEET